tara:strand:- start:9 stop:773 length:765 start_codon:yes stop_codon:yes gene_type:complete
MNVLEKICKLKMEEVEVLKKNSLPEKKLKTRNFLESLVNNNAINYNVIAEIKKKSPSKGLICDNFDLEKIATEYEKAGAKCISVLTEKNFFGGKIDFLTKVKNVVSIPILRKDFIIDKWQIYESYYNGADCILLILAILNDDQIKEFYKISQSLGMDVICEVHDNDELKRALNLDVNCIGINNRNLKTLKINTDTFLKLQKKIPKGKIKICESGIHSNIQLVKFTNQGADAFLIGESLMSAKNIFDKTRNLIKK